MGSRHAADVGPRAQRAGWDPRGWVQHGLKAWRRSMQVRIVVITVILCGLAEVVTGALLSARIADGLFQERLAQVRSEATTWLRAADSSFRSAATGDRSSTQTLVNDTLRSLRGDDTIQREYVLRVISRDGTSWVPEQNSSPEAEDAIPSSLGSSVEDGNEIYWESVALHSGDETHPGVAFGKRVQIAPNRDYALYIVYDFQQVQSTLELVHRVLWLGFSLLLVVIGGIAWYTVKRVLHPVSQAARTAEKLAEGSLTERMQVNGDDEVARLGRSFNRMADSLAAQIVQLENLSQMQQRFVSDVSHELRTPLTTVRMAAEVLHDARENFDPMNRRSAELLYDQVERFQELLADLLEISRFDAGAASLDAGPWDMVPVVDRVLVTARPLAEAEGVEIVTHFPPEPAIVEMDPRRVERIIRNLVLNAVEHGEGRPVEVTVAGDAEAVAVSVRDHGIGLSQEDAARVFDRFWRKDPARTRTTGGSGLGLAIAMQDARLHGGWLQAWGEQGQGSVFRLTLPRKAGGGLTSSPLPLADPTPAELAMAQAIEADDSEWFPRTGLALPGSSETDAAQEDPAAETVPGTLHIGLPTTGGITILPRRGAPEDVDASDPQADEGTQEDDDHEGGKS
ncbi:MtrAB system histidine kinase MtrB [Galactobacter sp.]|uniref:MtrAB system histidine kinase MtrB n=1 Tax=Galactobacter sp. TaxID=2676125 RepID=UPI0025C41BFB|nr:MtrAB system histidine kinase MtrB [Galactobacter sp.]